MKNFLHTLIDILIITIGYLILVKIFPGCNDIIIASYCAGGILATLLVTANITIKTNKED